MKCTILKCPPRARVLLAYQEARGGRHRERRRFSTTLYRHTRSRDCSIISMGNYANPQPNSHPWPTEAHETKSPKPLIPSPVRAILLPCPYKKEANIAPNRLSSQIYASTSIIDSAKGTILTE
ncbi:hypothetical protein BDW72DRAFT_175932 [Aspergillus terricola var. indicus]